MGEQLQTMVPSMGNEMLLRLGGQDPHRARQILLAMYAFLADKPVNTRRSYRTSLKLFFDLMDWKDPKSVTVADAAGFKRWLVDQKFSKSTVCVRLAAVDGFFKFLTQPVGEDGKLLLAANPFAVVSRKDVLPQPFGRSKVLGWKDFLSMVEALPDSPVGLRDKAVLLFLANTARRRSEVSNLRVRDLDLQSRPRTYRATVKGGKEKSFELPQICYDAIRAHWLSADRLKKMGPESGVFAAIGSCPLTHHLDPERPLHNSVVSLIVKRAASRAGLDPSKVTVHSIRHMVAHDLDKAGARLQDIQRFLDHANPNTTTIYLQLLRGAVPALEKELSLVRGDAITIAEPVVNGGA